jgi:hypothetical protein
MIAILARDKKIYVNKYVSDHINGHLHLCLCKYTSYKCLGEASRSLRQKKGTLFIDYNKASQTHWPLVKLSKVGSNVTLKF